MDRFLRRPEIERITGMRRSTLYEAIAADRFPKPVPIGRRAVGWLESEVAEWQAACVARRDKKGGAAS